MKEMTTYEILWKGIKSSNIYILLVFDKISDTTVELLGKVFKPFELLSYGMEIIENCKTIYELTQI